jgi:hypothetical protein
MGARGAVSTKRPPHCLSDGAYDSRIHSPHGAAVRGVSERPLRHTGAKVSKRCSVGKLSHNGEGYSKHQRCIVDGTHVLIECTLCKR